MELSSWTLMTLLFFVVIADSNDLWFVLLPCFCFALRRACHSATLRSS